MNSEKLVRIAAAVLLLMAAVIVIGVVFPFKSGSGREISIQDIADTPDSETESNGGFSGADRVSVNTGNVAEVIRTLARPESYSRTFEVKTYWDGGSAVYAVETYADGGVLRTNVISDDETKNILTADGKAYIWFGSGSAFHTGSAADGDKYQMLVTYEDIAEIPEKDIQYADYGETDGIPCICAQYVSGELGYVTKCFVSVGMGLVIAAERYSGDTLVYSMRETSFTPGKPDASAFQLPDGTAVTADP